MGRRFRWIFFVFALQSVAADAIPRVEIGALTFDDIPEPDQVLVRRLEPYLDARSADVLGWSPTGQLLIATRFADVAQLHLLEHAGGARRQLSFGPEAVSAAQFSPDISHPGFAFAGDGDGRGQLHYQQLDEPAPRLLTDGKSSNADPVWSNKGKELVFTSNARDGLNRDVMVVDAQSGALPHLVVAAEGAGADWTPLDWSPDDRQLLLLKTVAADDYRLFIVELETGQKREIEAGPKNRITGARFARDAQGVYYVSDRDGEFLQLRYVNLYNGQRQTLADRNAADVTEFALSGDGHYLAYVLDAAGGSKLEIVDLRTHQDLTPPRLPAPGVVGSLHFDPEGRRLAFGYSSLRQPRDAYVVEIEANRLERWTSSETGRIDTAKFVAPRDVAIPTFDRGPLHQREIPTQVTEPATPGRHPVLIVLGDEAAGPFDPWVQYLTGELGFVVVAPRVRGSSGHGKSYRALGVGPLREDAVKDVGAVLVWVRAQAGFDPSRVFVAGQGPGGSLALEALFNYGERLRGAIALQPITDFVAFAGEAAPDSVARRRAEYGDEREPAGRALLRRLSPLANTERITKPLLIVQADAEIEISAAQSEQLVNSVRSRNVKVWYLRVAGEKAPFLSRHAEEAYRQTFAQFLVSPP